MVLMFVLFAISYAAPLAAKGNLTEMLQKNMYCDMCVCVHKRGVIMQSTML